MKMVYFCTLLYLLDILYNNHISNEFTIFYGYSFTSVMQYVYLYMVPILVSNTIRFFYSSLVTQLYSSVIH